MSSKGLDAIPTHIAESPFDWLSRQGLVFAEFGAKTQDSGNISYGVRLGDRTCFVKTAGHPADPVPVLDHVQRVALLRGAVALRAECDHPALPELLHVTESIHGPMLFYDWCDGDLLRRDALQRFRGLPTERVLTALDTIYDLHRLLAVRGWIAEDFYDGCLIYDFARHRLRVIDLDSYRRGPTANPGRRFGSSRFMAPEESIPGAVIDERTTVYTLGRTAAVLAADGGLERSSFRGDNRLFATVTKACTLERERRYASVAEFVNEWEAARRAHAQGAKPG
jgi:serine/threonine-protein kinase